MPSMPTAHRLSCNWTRSRMNGIWFLASLASVKQNSSRSWSMKARGVQEKTSTPSKRPPVSGTTTSPLWRRGGAQKRTLGNGAGSTPSAVQPSRAPSWASNAALGRSSHSRSSPLTLNTRTRRFAAPEPTTSGVEVSIRRKNRANDVLVATPEIPLMDMWPPFRPSKKSRSKGRPHVHQRDLGRGHQDVVRSVLPPDADLDTRGRGLRGGEPPRPRVQRQGRGPAVARSAQRGVRGPRGSPRRLDGARRRPRSIPQRSLLGAAATPEWRCRGPRHRWSFRGRGGLLLDAPRVHRPGPARVLLHRRQRCEEPDPVHP